MADEKSEALRLIDDHRELMSERPTPNELWMSDEISHKEAFDKMAEQWREAESLIADLERLWRASKEGAT